MWFTAADRSAEQQINELWFHSSCSTTSKSAINSDGSNVDVFNSWHVRLHSVSYRPSVSYCHNNQSSIESKKRSFWYDFYLTKVTLCFSVSTAGFFRLFHTATSSCDDPILSDCAVTASVFFPRILPPSPAVCREAGSFICDVIHYDYFVLIDKWG